MQKKHRGHERGHERGHARGYKRHQEKRIMICKNVKSPRRVALKKRWTSCADDLPDDELTVMIFDPKEDEPVWLGYLDGKTWRTVEGVRVSVTHWMPMPEPPKQKGGAA